MTRRRQPQRMTAADTMIACARCGVWLARDPESETLYLWNQDTDDLEEKLSDRLFGAIIRNQKQLLRMVRFMDEPSRIDVGAEPFSQASRQTKAME